MVLLGVWTLQSKKLVYYASYIFEGEQKFIKFEAEIFGLIFQTFLRAFESQNHLNKSDDMQALHITPATSSWAVIETFFCKIVVLLVRLWKDWNVVSISNLKQKLQLRIENEFGTEYPGKSLCSLCRTDSRFSKLLVTISHQRATFFPFQELLFPLKSILLPQKQTCFIKLLIPHERKTKHTNLIFFVPVFVQVPLHHFHFFWGKK